MLFGTLNAIRRAHPALQQLRQLHFHHAGSDAVIAYSKRDGDDVVIVICSLDPDNQVESDVWLDFQCPRARRADHGAAAQQLTWCGVAMG